MLQTSFSSTASKASRSASVLPGIFQETLFTRSSELKPSHFIRPMHPKAEIRPLREAMNKILDAGWVGQLKIHGHRAQIHISADPEQPVLAFNRQGDLHKRILPDFMVSELRRIFAPVENWNVIDAEWIKGEDKIFVFDFLKQDGKTLDQLNFSSRWKLLPRAYISPMIQTLGILTTLDQCLESLKRTEPYIEGLVFKSPSRGFEDSSILRCRK